MKIWSFGGESFGDVGNLRPHSPLTAAAAKLKMQFTYDWLGRRVQKTVAEWDSGTSSYASLSKTFGYIYDGWNLAVELENGVVSRRYVWGPDVSGSMQGAGGVGGLLAVMPAAGNPQMVFSDANGNVTKLADIKTQTVTAEYEYGPSENSSARPAPWQKKTRSGSARSTKTSNPGCSTTATGTTTQR